LAVTIEANELALLVKKVDMKSIWDMIEKDYKNFSEGISKQTLQYKLKIPVSHLI